MRFGVLFMNGPIDIVDLAEELARIAAATTDRETARRLMEIVERLLGAAGMSRDGEPGGGEPPPDRVMEPVWCPA
jgi:hypothetical protein